MKTTSVCIYIWTSTAVRDPKRTGLPVLLIEKSVYEANLTRLNEPSSGDKKKIVRRSSTYPKGTKGLHELGHSWGYSEYLKDNVLRNIKSLDEGSYSLAQTGVC